MSDTYDLLEKHHGGAQFHDLMVASSPGRFNESFWQFWHRHAEPVLPEKPRLLDLGTGPGLLLAEWAQRYPGGQYYGVDVMPYMLENAAQRLGRYPGIQLFATDLHEPRLPLDANSIDVATCIVLLHEMIQPIRLLQTIQTLLKPGGRLIVVDWIRASIRQYFEANTVDAMFRPDADTALLNDRMTHFYEHNRYAPDDLAWLLENTGFRVLAMETYKTDRFVRIAAERR